MNWPVVRITEVARVVGGATPKSDIPQFWGGDIDWATPKDLSDLDSPLISSTPRKITEAGLKGSAAEILPPGSVLFSSRAPIGHIAINTVPMATNQGFKSFVPGKDIDAGFLYWWLDAHRKRLQAMGTGATFKELSKAAVERIEISLPPLSDQRRIAGILDEAARLCRLRARALEKLSSLGQAIFQEMFGNDPCLHSIPTKKLAEVIKVSSGQGLTASQMRHGVFPVYGGNGVNGYHEEAIFPEKTIVIGRVGAYCGSVHVTKSPCWVTDNALVVKKLIPANTEYLAVALRTAQLNQYAGRAAQPLVSGSRIYPVEIPFPPVELQNEFALRIATTLQCQGQLIDAENRQHRLFDSLQHRAFQGKL